MGHCHERVLPGHHRQKKADGPASFQSFGAGYISACPDPDGAGPKYAILRDTNDDGGGQCCPESARI